MAHTFEKALFCKFSMCFTFGMVVVTMMAGDEERMIGVKRKMETRRTKNERMIFVTLFALLICSASMAQSIISQFDFNTTIRNKLKKATIGLNASDISGDVDSDGSRLYFQTGGTDIGVDLQVDYGSSLNAGSIEIEFRFRKNENNCHFFERPTMSAFCLNGYLYFTYRISNGADGYSDVTISSSNPIANHADFKTYLFSYDAATGMGGIKVAEDIVASYQGPSGRNLYWNGASGVVTLGRQMDGGGADTRFLDWMIIRNGVSSPLPVELTSFTASLTGSGATLRWKTATEADNYGFEVQRSIDRLHWTPIGFVAGHGTCNVPQFYSFNDPAAGSFASIAYRLKQIDRSGAVAYSAPVTVAPGAGALSLTNFPNPFNPATNIRFTLPESARVTLAVYNEIGQLMTRIYDNTPLDAGAQVVSFDGSKYASGSYFARLSIGGKDKVIRMVLVK